ncbi:MAG: hypothetical protein ABWW66_02615 [Archaeoglobaceae archaeon]
MKEKIVIVTIFAAIVFATLYVYAFAVSPKVVESSKNAWLEKEIARSVKFADSSVCMECHANVGEMRIHSTVQCEACHGAGMEHAEGKGSVIVDKSRGFCLNCHLDVEGRNVATVGEGHHAGIYCTVCHDPHS